MENQNVLLTYEYSDGRNGFGWFEGIEEVQDFIDENSDLKILECQEIIEAKDVGDQLNIRKED